MRHNFLTHYNSAHFKKQRNTQDPRLVFCPLQGLIAQTAIKVHQSICRCGIQAFSWLSGRTTSLYLWANCAHTLMLLKYCRNGECVHLLKQRLTSRGELGEQMTNGPSASACLIIDQRSN